MNHASGTTATGDGGTFDPRQAAALLEQTSRQTRRKLTPSPPWLLTARGIGVLLVLGTVWLSVRGQHPYHYPTAAVVPVCVAFGLLNFGVTTAFRMRATSGVGGKSQLHRAEIVVLAAVWVGVFAAIPVMAAAGVRDAVVYGVYPAAAPLIAAGVAWAAMMAARANWRGFGTGAGVAVTGAVGAFSGPAGAWLVAGIGLCAVLAGTAAVITWQQHRSAVRP